MAYVPADAEWFLAALVQEICVAGCKRNIVHINYIIIHAPSPKAAYLRAKTVGKQGAMSYVNTHGKKVTIKFRGLRNLDVIYDPLEDGCEIMFEEKLGVTKSGVKKMVRSKREMEVFQPIKARRGRPDFSSKEIMDIVEDRLKKKNKRQAE